jgi:hypothetical protein
MESAFGSPTKIRRPGCDVAFQTGRTHTTKKDCPVKMKPTLRLADNQKTIDDVSFTAGNAAVADGQGAPALLGLLYGDLDCVLGLFRAGPKTNFGRRDLDPQSQRWIAANEDWILRIGGILPVPVEDPGIFPLRIISRLPLQRSGEVIAVEIRN